MLRVRLCAGVNTLEHPTYDALGRVLAETDELNDVRSYESDAVGNLVETTDANGRVTKCAYDALGRETAETWAGRKNNLYNFWDRGLME